ncbi:MAG: hypothetical protein ACR2FY_14920 [Pirellulaceae bacterium]
MGPKNPNDDDGPFGQSADSELIEFICNPNGEEPKPNSPLVQFESADSPLIEFTDDARGDSED